MQLTDGALPLVLDLSRGSTCADLLSLVKDTVDRGTLAPSLGDLITGLAVHIHDDTS